MASAEFSPSKATPGEYFGEHDARFLAHTFEGCFLRLHLSGWEKGGERGEAGAGGAVGAGEGHGLSADAGTCHPARLPKELPSFQ